jgi:predicted Zn-dependent protease with MMP-like domain
MNKKLRLINGYSHFSNSQESLEAMAHWAYLSSASGKPFWQKNHSPLAEIMKSLVNKYEPKEAMLSYNYDVSEFLNKTFIPRVVLEIKKWIPDFTYNNNYIEVYNDITNTLQGNVARVLGSIIIMDPHIDKRRIGHLLLHELLHIFGLSSRTDGHIFNVLWYLKNSTYSEEIKKDIALLGLDILSAINVEVRTILEILKSENLSYLTSYLSPGPKHTIETGESKGTVNISKNKKWELVKINTVESFLTKILDLVTIGNDYEKVLEDFYNVYAFTYLGEYSFESLTETFTYILADCIPDTITLYGRKYPQLFLPAGSDYNTPYKILGLHLLFNEDGTKLTEQDKQTKINLYIESLKQNTGKRLKRLYPNIIKFNIFMDPPTWTDPMIRNFITILNTTNLNFRSNMNLLHSWGLDYEDFISALPPDLRDFAVGGVSA